MKAWVRVRVSCMKVRVRVRSYMGIHRVGFVYRKYHRSRDRDLDCFKGLVSRSIGKGQSRPILTVNKRFYAQKHYFLLYHAIPKKFTSQYLLPEMTCDLDL